MRPAVLAGVFAMLNMTLFVQARIAMLDGFMAAFAVAGVAVLLGSMRAAGKQALMRVAPGGALIGLARGCNWAAVPILGVAGLALRSPRHRKRVAYGKRVYVRVDLGGTGMN